MTLSRQTPDSDLPDIRVPLDTVCFIIAKSREFDVKTASSDPMHRRLMMTTSMLRFSRTGRRIRLKPN